METATVRQGRIMRDIESTVTTTKRHVRHPGTTRWNLICFIIVTTWDLLVKANGYRWYQVERGWRDAMDSPRWRELITAEAERLTRPRNERY